jgi:hypothetical protein
MKKIITICAVILMTASAFAQAPNKMSYQAVIRNSSNALVSNQSVGIRISILQGSSSGTPVYVETQTSTTNSNGLASIEIGGGTIVSGNLSSISWANGPYFIKTETDPTGGATYSIVGTTQLLSVPYALYAENAGNASASSFQGVKIGFNNSTTWICPANVTQITVEVWGAGGGSGGQGVSYCPSDTLGFGNGGAGGKGGYNKQSITVTPGTSYIITVGNQGTNGTSNYSSNSSCGISNGAAGESSSFGSIVTAMGGTGGSIGCSQCNSTNNPGTNGTDGVVTNYTSATSLSRPYIPNGYLGLTPGCCASSGVKGAVVISY